ncbi:fibrous sheath-interacting protein 1 isoform X4 [Haliaeetus albicilla]|uniref:fibrous sheath-interacting protein 1 isoform X4 n=1 Tax=Haliaeetus albicilla TaxID=8969 RepID=UPI0037E92B03
MWWFRLREQVRMDITRGSLDKISRPASSSRAYPNCRSLNTSMELLTPEPHLPKVDSPVSLAGSHQRGSLEDCCLEENKGDDREKSDVKEVRTDQQTTVASTTFLQEEHMLNPNELSGCIYNSDSGDDSTETETLKFCEPSQGKPSNAKAANSSNLEYSEETGVDPQIQAAIKKMNKLDTILAKKHLKERAIKKQGKEMRAKLWKELQSIRITGSHEEIENTKLFLALISSWQDKADPSHAKEDEICSSVFHTQINPEDYDCHKPQHNQDYPSELETNEFLNQAEKTHSKSKNNQDFIKKNIELAKDSGNQIVMLEGERKRLIELLKDTEDGIELQGLEEDVSGWLAPGEGYTPEPMEFHHLNEIDIKLQVLLSDGDFSAISSSCSKLPSQIYQESLVYANRSLEAVPGEKVLRDNKEQRDQQSRLKEIDHQLKSFERNLKKRWVQIDIQEVPLNIRGKKPQQQPTVRVIEDQNRWLRGCGVAILKETQNLTGHSPEQPTLVDSTLSRVFGLGNLQKSFPISTML